MDVYLGYCLSLKMGRRRSRQPGTLTSTSSQMKRELQRWESQGLVTSPKWSSAFVRAWSSRFTRVVLQHFQKQKIIGSVHRLI